MTRPVTPVGVLAQKLQHLQGVLTNLSVDDTAELASAVELAAGLDPYVNACTTPESTALRSLARRTAAEDWAAHADAGAAAPLEQEMLSGHVEGQLLKFLVRATGARRVLDIGMFTGYSALAMAEALPAEGVVVACEVDAFVGEFARGCFEQSPHGSKIDVRVAAASDTLASLAAAGDCFDFVFIDADKVGYVSYFRTLLDTGLLTQDGVICVDNTLMQGQPYTPGTSTAIGEAVAEFNRVVADDPRVEQVLLPVRDGITLIRRIDR